MKREKHINPLVALLIAILLYLLASTLEPKNIKEDQQAQIDCRIKDSVNNNITDNYNE